jgi:aminopeptidase N
MKDAADMWIHEGFASYAEAIYTECQQGKKAGAEYVVGDRRHIDNDAPIIGTYGVNSEGSGDMYSKGESLLHTIRQLVDDDSRWRGIMRGLGRTFWHQNVSSAQIEGYITRQTGLPLAKIFDQYLRTTRIPALEYKLAGNKLSYRWTDVVPGFAMPVKVTTAPDRLEWIRPTEAWKTTIISITRPEDFRVDENFYVVAKDLLKPPTDSATVRKAQ